MATLQGQITRYLNDLISVEVTTPHGRINVFVPSRMKAAALSGDELTAAERRDAWDKAKLAAQYFLKEAS